MASSVVLPPLADAEAIVPMVTAPPLPGARHALTDSSEVIAPPDVIAMVLSSVAAVAPPEPATTSCRLLADDAAVKFVNFSPATVTWSPPAKSDVTFSTAVLLLSS